MTVGNSLHEIPQAGKHDMQRGFKGLVFAMTYAFSDTRLQSTENGRHSCGCIFDFRHYSLSVHAITTLQSLCTEDYSAWVLSVFSETCHERTNKEQERKKRERQEGITASKAAVVPSPLQGVRGDP